MIGWKGLDRLANGRWQGPLQAVYEIGKVFITLEASNFLFSYLGCARNGYGRYDGAFLIRLSDCRLRADQVVDCYSPARLLEVRKRQLNQPAAKVILASSDFEKIEALEQQSRPKLASLVTLPTDQECDELVGYYYSQLKHPVHPFYLPAVEKITQAQLKLLKRWASVQASVWDSVGVSVWDSVEVSVQVSVGASVQASVWAYIGWHFPNIKSWQHVEHQKGDYPFQAAVDLWLQGIVPVTDGNNWCLLVSHGDGSCRIGWQGSVK